MPPPPPEDEPVRPHLQHELKTYRSLNKFKQAVLTIAASMLEESAVGEGRKLFTALDQDGNGRVSVSELTAYLRRLEGKPGRGIMDRGKGSFADDVTTACGSTESLDDDSKAVKEAFCDVVAGAKVSVQKEFTYTEFLAATLKYRVCLREKVLRAAFSYFDRNGDGSISMAELSSGHLMGHLSMEELSEIMDSFDQDGDFHIDFKEFTDMMMSGK